MPWKLRIEKQLFASILLFLLHAICAREATRTQAFSCPLHHTAWSHRQIKIMRKMWIMILQSTSQEQVLVIPVWGDGGGGIGIKLRGKNYKRIERCKD